MQLLASQTVNATLNAAGELRPTVAKADRVS